MKKYSAGIAAKSFWFLEFKKYLQLERNGKNKQEIKELQISENIFSSKSKRTGLRIVGEISSRSEKLDIQLKELFFQVDLENQKVINLISILKSDLLFFEFMYLGYREELIIGIEKFELKVVRKFLRDKQTQSDEVLEFTEGTIKRLCGAYSTNLKQAGLIDDISGQMKYKRIILDYRLESILKENNNLPYYKVIKGVV